MMINIGTITNVKVSEVGKKDFTKTNKWAYHLDKNYYFGGLNNDDDFEIAWGVGLDNRSATKTYEITYTVTDAISKYKDCAELYWQFLGADFEIDASEINGTIKLPSKANSKKDIRVWGHVETLNGEIYATNLDTVKFSLNEYESGNFLEVRMAMPIEMFGTVTRTYNKNMLDYIIEEETEWAEEANAKRERQEKIKNLVMILVYIIIGIISIFLIRQTIKYIKILKSTKKLIPTQKYQYYREKTNNYSTPADALFLYINGNDIVSTFFGDIFSATLLNLSLKGYFNIEVEKDEKGKEKVVIRKNGHFIGSLQEDESIIVKFINDAMNGKEEITNKELQRYIKGHEGEVILLITRMKDIIKNKNKIAGNYNEQTAELKSKYSAVAVIYLVITIITTFFSIAMAIRPFFLVIILFIINALLATLIDRKLSNLTQKGIDEREKWKGLKKYMEEFSLLNEKEVPALSVWEEYLVYATVFGIANKVIKQLKIVYPEIEQMNNFNTHSYVYLMSHTNFNSTFSRSISSAMSSGSGGGGGFSGGGGGGRRPEAADGGR